MSNFSDVGDFHHKFNLDNVTHKQPGPRPENQELMQFRLKFMLEELLEFAEATNFVLGFDPALGKFTFTLPGPNAQAAPVDHAKAFDSLLDLAYVVFGSAQVLGYPWQEGWDAVQTANMQKIRVTRIEDSLRGSTFDVVKPPGWTPPDITDVLRKRGFPI